MVERAVMTPEEFYDDLKQEILARAGAEENFTRTTFLDFMCSKLEEEGFISGFELTEHKISSRGQAVDAWSFDDELSKLTLFIGDYRNSESLETLTNGEITKLFKRLRKFLDSSLSPRFAEDLEEADPVAGLAWFIAESGAAIESVSLVILSNAQLSARVGELPNDKVSDFKATYEIWDFGRIYRNEASGKTREDLVIDLGHLDGGGLPCLPAYTGTDALKSFLLVMPGRVLADLYGEFGERLLEQNVRTFLQFRGKINKGIRNTIVHEPEMFFAYNNGLSATAEDVETIDDDSRIVRVRNLQIVNGGQTTASIFTASKKEKADLDQVYVQVKLSVIDPEEVEEIVPRISEYSNTQNRVNAADFFANHPFHLRVEEFSRRLWAPSPEGGLHETHWFYERARGQFANQQAHLTPSERKKFLAQNPRSQMFTKTDLAKFILSFEEVPHEVSLGAQKAFAGTPRTDGFVGRIAKQWEKAELVFNEIWFKRAIAKAICFRDIDRHIFKQPWYAGYKANLVTYTLAKFSHTVRNNGWEIDFLQIWETQRLSENMLARLGIIAKAVNRILHSPPEGVTSMVSEWAKKTDCWPTVRDADVKIESWDPSDFIDGERSNEQDKEGVYVQDIQAGIHAQTYVVERGAEHWSKLREWNNVARKLSPKEMGVLNVACSIPRKIPTEKQASVLIDAEKRAINEGFYSR
jgi:hypothetical protein